jgi:hypothetical protein
MVVPRSRSTRTYRHSEEQHLRRVHQRLPDEEPPLHPARERPRVGPPLPDEVERRQDLEEPLLAEPHAEVAGLDAQRLLDGEERVEVDLLRYYPERTPGEAVVGHHVPPEHPHLALACSQQAGDDRDERGLPGAVGAEQREDLALFDVEVDAGEGLEGLEALLHTADGDDRVRHGRRM